MKILTIDDDATIQELFATGLCSEGFDIIQAFNAKDGLALIEEQVFDCIILDNMLPDIAGISLCTMIRDKGFDIPIIALSVQTATDQKVLFLNAGADDYMEKPFMFSELIARIHAITRRAKTQKPDVITHRNLTYDLRGGKLTMDRSLDPMVRVTLWKLVLGQAFHALVQMATDQVAVQRYMTATSLKTAQRGLWMRLWMTLPVTAVFYLSGVVLYAYYQSQHFDPLAAGAIRKADQILPYFVVNALPAGMGGLLISAIFSASMNVCSSGINAMTTAALMDFYKRLWRPDVSEAQQLRLARWMTIGFGVLVCALAFVVERMGTLVEGAVKMMAITGGPLLGLFFLGMLTKRANGKGAIVGWFVGIAVLLPICFATTVSFLWHACIGCVVTYVAGFVASAFFAAETKPLDGLTVATRYVPEK